MEISVEHEGVIDLARMEPTMRQATLMRLRQQHRAISCTCRAATGLPSPPLTIHVWSRAGQPQVGLRNLPRTKNTKDAMWRGHAFECPFARHDEGWAAALRRDGWKLSDDGTWEAALPPALPAPWGTPTTASLITHQNNLLANWATWLLYRARWGRFWPDRARQIPQRLWHAGADATINGMPVQDVLWAAGGPIPFRTAVMKRQVLWAWGPAPRGVTDIPLHHLITHEPLGSTLRIPVPLQPSLPAGASWATNEGHWVIYRPSPRETAAVAFLPAEPVTGIPVDSPTEREVLRVLAAEGRPFAKMLIGKDAPDAPPRLRLLGVQGEPEIVILGDPRLPARGEAGPAAHRLLVTSLRSRDDLVNWVRRLPSP